ncbi:hypothetical protein BHE74_00029246, partial [Ensete ventricosum]
GGRERARPERREIGMAPEPEDDTNEKNPRPLDEDDIALLKTYGLGPYSVSIKKTEKEIKELAKRVNDLCGMFDRNKYQIQIPLPPKIDPSVTMMTVEEKPDVTYNDVGGCKEQIEKMREVVELPMLHPEKFVKLGIDPPKGVLCYGPPGTGKTLLARAVANRTDACFIRVIGSELVQKYVGEGARMVRELFQVVKHLSKLLCSYEFLQERPCLCLASTCWFSIGLFTNLSSRYRWHAQKKPALSSLMKLMQLVVLGLMMGLVATMKFSAPCLKLSISLMDLMLEEILKF